MPLLLWALRCYPLFNCWNLKLHPYNWLRALACLYPHEATKAAIIRVFRAIRQFGGRIPGEHLCQLFTIAWTLLMTMAFMRLKLFPRRVNGLGILSAGIYLTAQAKLLDQA